MEFETAAGRLYAYTGGQALAPSRRTVVFIHGVLNDHSVWILQSRYLAHHGYNVLALDLPGHGRSQGEAPASVQAASQAVISLLDAAEIQSARLVGHSWGSLIALHTAAQHPERVEQLALVGTAYPMRVSPALLELSRTAPEQAIAMVNTFSHSTLAPPPSALGPGTWLYGASRALMRRVLASNREVNVFERGFNACDSYAEGESDMQAVQCPILFILGSLDQMTPPKAAQTLIGIAAQKGLPHRVVTVKAGHSLMTEAPDEVLMALREGLQALKR